MKTLSVSCMKGLLYTFILLIKLTVLGKLILSRNWAETQETEEVMCLRLRVWDWRSFWVTFLDNLLEKCQVQTFERLIVFSQVVNSGFRFSSPHKLSQGHDTSWYSPHLFIIHNKLLKGTFMFSLCLHLVLLCISETIIFNFEICQHDIYLKVCFCCRIIHKLIFLLISNGLLSINSCSQRKLVEAVQLHVFFTHVFGVIIRLD